MSASNVGDPGSIPGSGRSPGERNGNPLQFLPGESQGRGSLVGYSPRGCKESDTTELLHFHSTLLIVTFQYMFVKLSSFNAKTELLAIALIIILKSEKNHSPGS